MVLFQELAGRWNSKLRELEYLGNDVQTPELHDFETCIIAECITTAKVETYKLKEGDPVLPRCYICFQMARHPIILDISYGRNVKASIQRFYKELVPKIVEHYEREHKFLG